ncbi:uncharacterized protein LTR77_006549 [Saxophila tyrrhenica]|uniref:Uncharacterized protein n=1 Tax=Saxophila tyrrhenica TaxID=1690608 RepID=A0AAV9P751_9PEZI|nr:hypothetical protein LTR77_006549 [Saxophila tyrrhenica]
MSVPLPSPGQIVVALIIDTVRHATNLASAAIPFIASTPFALVNAIDYLAALPLAHLPQWIASGLLPLLDLVKGAIFVLYPVILLALATGLFHETCTYIIHQLSGTGPTLRSGRLQCPMNTVFVLTHASYFSTVLQRDMSLYNGLCAMCACSSVVLGITGSLAIVTSWACATTTHNATTAITADLATDPGARADHAVGSADHLSTATEESEHSTAISIPLPKATSSADKARKENEAMVTQVIPSLLVGFMVVILARALFDAVVDLLTRVLAGLPVLLCTALLSYVGWIVVGAYLSRKPGAGGDRKVERTPTTDKTELTTGQETILEPS